MQTLVWPGGVAMACNEFLQQALRISHREHDEVAEQFAS